MKNLTSLAYLIIYMCALLIPNLAQAQAAPGAGTVDNPYLISTPAQLDAVRNDKTAHYKLVADINLADYLSSGGAGYNSGAGWQPIGTEGTEETGYNVNAFKGTFDGNGHTISGLYINNTDRLVEFQSLFGKVAGATIKNLGVADVNITSKSKHTGAIAGKLEEGAAISGCFTSGTLILSIATPQLEFEIGGIVGTAAGGSTVENCYSLCNVTSNKRPSGGIAGLIQESSLVANCYASGSISGNAYAGGLVGMNTNSTIQNSVAANDYVNGSVGGRIAGSHSGTSPAYHNNYANNAMTGYVSKHYSTTPPITASAKPLPT